MTYKEGPKIPLGEVNKKVVAQYRKGLMLLIENQERRDLKSQVRDGFDRLEEYYKQELSKRGLLDTYDKNYTLWTMIDSARAYIELTLPGQPVSKEYLEHMVEKVDNLFKDQE
jgi:hypothetical protein